MAAMHDLKGWGNLPSYRLGIAITRDAWQIWRCQVMLTIILGRVRIILRRSDGNGGLGRRAGKANLGNAEEAVLGNIHHQKKHQNEQQRTPHLGLASRQDWLFKFDAAIMDDYVKVSSNLLDRIFVYLNVWRATVW